MGGIKSRKLSPRHHFTRSQYFFICISFHYQRKHIRTHARMHAHSYVMVYTVAMSPKALAGPCVCESAYPWLPALQAMGGTGNFSNDHKNVKREF